MTNHQVAYFAGGCFWGVEYYFQNLPGVINTQVGYMGGAMENPTYEQVCAHITGHAETIRVDFDADQVSYENLTKLFFEIHDPTQVNRQGPDIGDQYRSEIFYTTDEQKQTAQKFINILIQKGFKVATKLTKAQKFYPAEDYHQKYYDKNGQQPYCHVRVSRFD